MRLRKIKNIDEKIAEHHQYIIDDPRARKGKWRQVFRNGNELFAEFGCGRGQFIMTLAEQNPARNYIAVEGRSSVILRALEKAAKTKLDNLVFVKEYMRDVDEYFDKDELAGIYLNFCDPWPKGSHAPRRLIHSRFLNGYRQILKEGSCIEFKTDNDALFAFAKREFEKSGMQVLRSTEDLHSTEYGAKSVTTEYEDKFKAQGKKINYCMVKVSARQAEPGHPDSWSSTTHRETKYTDKEEEYLNQLTADGMERKEAENFLDIMKSVAPGDFSKGLGCIRRPPRWMK